MVSSNLPTEYGDFKAIVYEDDLDHNTHLVLVKGDIKNLDKVLVRVHSGCVTGDIFRSKRCDCGEQLLQAMKMIENEGAGVILYINHDTKAALVSKIRSYKSQDEGEHIDLMEEGKPVLRDYGVGAQILVDLGIRHIRLMTNNPRKIVGLEGYGLDVVERIPLETLPHADNIDYLKAKKSKLGHLLQGV